MKDNCPICDKTLTAEHDAMKPFCSKRCSDIDLGRWLKGSYAIAGQDGEALIPANDDSPESDNPTRDY